MKQTFGINASLMLQLDVALIAKIVLCLNNTKLFNAITTCSCSVFPMSLIIKLVTIHFDLSA